MQCPASFSLLMKLPQDVVDGVVFVALLVHGNRQEECASDENVRPILASLRGSCRGLKEAASMRAIARRCLSSACILEDLLLAQRRVVLHRFLRLSGGYQRAVQVFSEEIERVRGLKLPLPIVAVLYKLTGRLFTQISAYGEVRRVLRTWRLCELEVTRGVPCRCACCIWQRNARARVRDFYIRWRSLTCLQAEKLLQTALNIDKQEQGGQAEQVAASLHTLAEMLRGSVSACQVASERRRYALRGLRYASECLAIRNCSGAPNHDGRGQSWKRKVAVAHALHLLGYHCAEFACGAHAGGFFMQATAALSRAHTIFRELEHDEMTATVLQDLGLCYYYQRRYKEAMSLYTSAVHVIIRKLGACHPDLAVPTFNIVSG